MKKKELTYSELNPCILDVGLQGSDSWRTTPRRIYDHELMFCLQGKAYAKIAGIEYTLDEGGALLIPPGDEHLFWQTNPEENKIFFLHFDYVCDEKTPQIQAYYRNLRLYLELYASQLQQPDLIRKEVVLRTAVTSLVTRRFRILRSSRFSWKSYKGSSIRRSKV